MKYGLGLILILVSCSIDNSNNKAAQKSFPVLEYQKDDWAFYEGRWITQNGYVELELALKSGAFGYESDYTLHEAVTSERSASGTGNRGKYATVNTGGKGELGIRLLNLHHWDQGYLRYPTTDVFGTTEEMFFVTRGHDELIPCDNNFKPLTKDWRYTLHRRSNFFTVEGYVTFYGDSSEFYERNVMQKWSLANLESFGEVKMKYNQTAKEIYEGIYLKALAYTVSDTIPNSEKRLLVIKDIKGFNDDPNP